MNHVKTILLDDEYYFRQSLKKLIDWDACNITIVGDGNNGEVGLKLIKELQPDLAIVDINMPVMNGLELVKQIKQQNLKCKSIMLSGYSEFEYARQAISYDVFSYQLKPVDKTEFEDCIQEVVQCILSSRKALNIEKGIPSTGYNKLTSHAVYLIEQNYSNPIFNVAVLAQELHVNYSYLCTCFRKETSTTVNDFILNTRMKAACELLRQGIKNIGEIAMAVGYEDPSYFSKCFKKSMGKSPSEYIEDYRKNLREQISAK